MKIAFLSLLFILLSYCSFGQDYGMPKKIRKMTYSDFTTTFAINDTATVVIDIFFDKRDNGAVGEMTFLPVSAALFAIPYTQEIGALLVLISAPLFIHGSYTMVRFRKKKLHKVLTHYQSNKELPNWLQRKVDKRLTLYKVMEREY